MNQFEKITVLGTNFHKITGNELVNYITSSAKKAHKAVIGNVSLRDGGK